MTALPIPQGCYMSAKRHGDLVYTSGMTPRINGKLMSVGMVEPSVPIESYKDAFELAARNALTAARSVLSSEERVSGLLSLVVYIAAVQGFASHSSLADFASTYLQGELGDEGICARTTVGVASLPGNSPVEIQIVAIVENAC